MSPHNLDHEGSRVRASRCVDVINRFTDAVQSGGRSDRLVRQRHVVVDRSDETNDAEVTIGRCLVLCDEFYYHRVRNEVVTRMSQYE